MTNGRAAQPTPSGSGPPGWSQALRALREARGVTRDGWAARLAYGRSTVQRWERGEAVPDADAERALVALCREMGLFRNYDHGPLQGITVSAEWLSDLLAEARLGTAPSRSTTSAQTRPSPAQPSPPAPAPTRLSGATTFLFATLADSPRLRRDLGDYYAGAVAAVRDVIGAASSSYGGEEVAAGEMLVMGFPRVAQAVSAAVTAQQVLASRPWPDGASIHVRIGLHTGRITDPAQGLALEARQRGEEVCRAAHGGQILVSAAVAELARESLPPDTALLDLGEHRLADAAWPERLYQITVNGSHGDRAPRTLDTHPNNLPLPANRLIGREAERTRVRDLLGQESVRLVTLTGTGGTGKTRLALRVAAELLHDFADGAFMTPLEPVTDPGLVANAIAQALGVREQEGRALADTLRDYLRERELLLVLDNFEQVATAAPVVADLLAVCPRIKAIVTSRALLRLSGEQAMAVPPLPVSGGAASGEASAAVRLFAERARAARADFTLTETNTPVIAEICARLDGLPLAIELAAARLRFMSATELLERLRGEHGGVALGLLAGGPRDLPARQQTMRNAIAWSHDLLTEQERALFRRLAAFAGGFTLDAAEAVCGDVRGAAPGSPISRWDVLDVLAALADHSLIRTEEQRERVRYRMLEPIREYAAEMLAGSGEMEPVHTRHLDWCLMLAEQATPGGAEAERDAWLSLMETEHDNLRASFDRAIERGQAQEALRVAAALGPYWYERGHISEGLDRLMRALSAAPAADPLLRARALGQAGWLAWAKAEYSRAAAWLEESLTLYRTAGDAAGAASALVLLGRLTMLRGEPERTLALLEEALELYRTLGDTPGIAEALLRIGDAACWQGDLDRAETCASDCLALRRRLGDRAGQFDPLNVLARVAELRRNFEHARTLGEDALALARESGNTRLLADALQDQGRLLSRMGDRHRAASYQREGLTIYRARGMTAAIGFSLNSLAHTLAVMGDFRRAALLLGAAEGMRETVGFEMVPVFRRGEERLQAMLRAALGEEALANARAAGRAMSIDASIAEAMRTAGEQ